MASPAKMAKIAAVEDDTISGYIHNVTMIKVAVKNRSKYFNAIIQTSREHFQTVVVFSPEKHEMFVQAQKNKKAVKLINVKKRVSRDGGEYDVHCVRSTDMLVLDDVKFGIREPPQNVKKSLMEISVMAPKQHVGVVEVKAIVVNSATETVECRGVNVEMQTCQIQDPTAIMKIQLWEDQVGSLIKGHCYKITNLSTRSFAGQFFLTTTKSTEFSEIPSLPGLDASVAVHVEEPQVISVVGTVEAVEFAVSHRCAKCQAWQREFNSKEQFHRCQRCGMLQKCSSYQPTATGKATITGSSDESGSSNLNHDVSISQSPLRRYFESEGLLCLLGDSRDIEEHFLLAGLLKFTIQSGMATAIQKFVPEAAAVPSRVEHAVAAAEVGMEDVTGAEVGVEGLAAVEVGMQNVDIAVRDPARKEDLTGAEVRMEDLVGSEFEMEDAVGAEGGITNEAAEGN